MSNKQRLLFGIALYNSLIFSAQNGAMVNLPNNQHVGVRMGANNSTMTISYPFGKVSPSTLKQPKKIGSPKIGEHFSYQRKILEVAAEKELLVRALETKPMSEYITRKYIGEGDEYSFLRSLVAQMGFCESWHSVESSTQTLTEIYHYFEPSAWTQEGILDLFCRTSNSYNSRLANLLNGLITIKRKKYYVVPSLMAPCSLNLSGSTIDDFFDEKFMFPELPVPFQQFIQRQIEEEFPHVCMFDKPELVKEHSTNFLILFTALNNCGDNVAEIKSFFTSAAFQTHEEKTHFALSRYIKENRKEDNFWCSWLGVRCKK